MENQNNSMAKNNVMAILAYIGPMVIVSYLVAKDDVFTKFHIKQGLVLLVIEVASWFLGMVFWPLIFILNVINLIVLILAIIGIVNAAKNKEKQLPLVGDYAKYFTF